jgi:hypothetical protein
MLENNILNTIIYFDIFHYPLTEWECYHWLYGEHEKIGYQNFVVQLKKLVADNKLATASGFYFLPNKKNLIKTRQRRYMLAQLKYTIACRAIKIIRCLPFIKYVAICNSLSYNNAKEGSDIDLFIIAEAGKLWRARFVAASLMQLLMWRPTAKNCKDKICLSFLIADDHLNIQSMSIEDDVYMKYWLVQMAPIYDPNNIHEKLLQANDEWVKPDISNHLAYQMNDMRSISDSVFSKFIKNILQAIIYPSIWESILRRLQFAILSNDLKTIANKDTRVVMNDHALKFHVLDRREEFRDKFKARISNTRV